MEIKRDRDRTGACLGRDRHGTRIFTWKRYELELRHNLDVIGIKLGRNLELGTETEHGTGT